MESPDFTPIEDRFFRACLDPVATRRRQRQILVFGTPALICPLAVGYFTQSWAWVAGLAMIYIAITIWEKNAYGNGVLVYKSVVRKLQARLEQCESTRPHSPPDSR